MKLLREKSNDIYLYSYCKKEVGRRMQDLIILGILVLVIVIGTVYTVNHFKGKSGCCGGGNTYISKKKLKRKNSFNFPNEF